MSFLKKLFTSSSESSDSGIYLYVQCDNCEQIVRLRLEPEHELVPEAGGYRSHKTVVDQSCYRRMESVFRFDASKRLTEADIKGGKLVDEAAYAAQQS